MAEGNDQVTRPRNVILCCDGTGNEFSTDRSNVLRLCRSLDREADQLAYYDPGVGTLDDARALTRWRKLLFKRLDGAIGLSVRDNVLKAYAFLMQNWRDGDVVWLFGFSRGAYTVRALAGMLDWFGLVRAEHANVLPYLWNVYSDECGEIGAFDKRMRVAGGIRKTMGRAVRVHFLGAWDTVSSFGWIWRPRTLPETAKLGIVDHLRHAVAIDERRRCFVQNLFTPQVRSAGVDDPTARSCVQMLFAGAHSDVGGGYPANEAGLAKVALEWMSGEAESMGLRFAAEDRRIELHGKNGKEGPDPNGPMHNESKRIGWQIVEMLPSTRLAWSLTPVLALASIVLPIVGVLPWATAGVGVVAVLALRAVKCRLGRPRRFDRRITRGVPMPPLEVHPSVGQRTGYRPPKLAPRT